KWKNYINLYGFFLNRTIDTTIDQQVAMDKALVPHAKRLRIGRSNFRLLSDIKSKESTLQLVYDVLHLTPFFKAFLVTADVLEIYIQEFWVTANVHHHAIRFKMDNKKHIINLESFRDMLHICPRLPGQSFVEPSFEEEILSCLPFLGHSGAIRKLTDVNINKLHQPWRSFAAIINKCLTGKRSGYDSLRLSQAQILWGLYHKRNVDFAYLMWEDFVYQVEHKDTKKSNEMYYPRFTKVIIHHFMLKDPSILRKNKVNWHYVRDDHMFSMIKLVSRHQNTQQFGALLPIKLTNEEIRNSNAYKEYYPVATGVAPPKPKASGKQAAKASKAKSLSALSEIHISKASGSCADEGTGTLPGVPDVLTDDSKEDISWKSTDDEGNIGGDDDDDDGDDNEEGDGDNDDEDDDGKEGNDDDDDQEDEGDNDEDDEEKGGDDEQASDKEEFVHPSLSTHTEEEPSDEESFDPISKTPEDIDDEGNGEENHGLNVGREEGHDEEEEEDELYRDVTINQGRGIQTNQEFEDSHVTLTPINPDGQQQSSFMSSQFPPTSVEPLVMSTPTITPSTIVTITTTIQAPTPPTTALSTLIQDLPNFGSLFGFDNRLRTLEVNFSEFMQTNQFAGVVSAIPRIVQRYMDQRMNKAVNVAVQIQSDRLRDEAQKENDEFLKTIDENMQKIIKEQTSYAVAVDLSEMELKKILIEKMEGPTSESSAKKKEKTVVITTKDMQKRRNDVKARTTLLFALPDEHQLRLSKYETTKELWEAILNTFGGNEATKKTKKNQLKMQYGNFKAEGLETLEQTFNRLKAIVSHLEFMDVEIKQDDLNQKFLTSLAPEWLMYTIVWRNIDDLDTMSLDDVYNHFIVYDQELLALAMTASLSHDTVCAYIATQSNGSQIKYEDITQIDKDDIEEIDIKWNMALLSMRADRFWKKTGKRESYKQGPKEEEPAPKALMAIDGIGCDWSYMANEEENHALVADDEVLIEFALIAKSGSSSDNEVYDDSYCSKSCRKNTENLNTKISKLNEELSDCETDLYNYKRGLSQVEARLVEFKELEVKYCERIRVLERDVEIRDNKIEYLKNELEQSPLSAQIYSPPKKDLSWTGLPKFVDDTVTDYSRPTPSIDASKCNKSELQSSNFYVFEHGESTSSFMSKPMIKFVKEADYPRVFKINNTKNARKSTVKYAEKYRNISKGNKGKAVKASACWIWRPKQNTSEQGLNCNGVSVTFKKYQYIDTQGRLKRLGHLNFKTINKLVRNNLVKGLPSKCFKNDHTCVACLKGKQHKASCKTKLGNSISKPLHTLHINLFGPTSISNLNHKWYCLVVTDDFSRFTWTFFLRTKDETSSILRNFITEIENLKDLKVKIIRCDNGGKFKNQEMNEFCTKKGIKREFSNARTPQQNGVTKKRNRTLIEVARTMLADAKLHVTFWAEAVNNACYVQNRVLVNKSQNKTPYELFNSRIPVIGFLRPFGCHVMILNTLDHLGKFDAKGDEGYFVGYSLSIKSFRVFNKRTKKVEENLHVYLLENKLIEKGAGPNWLFDIDTLTNSMNYVPIVVTGTSSTNILGTKDVASQAVKKDVSSLRYIALPNWFHEAHIETSNDTIRKSDAHNDSQKEQDCNADVPESMEYDIFTASPPVPTVCLDISPESSNGSRLILKGVITQEEAPYLGNALTLSNRFEDTFGVEADLSNMETSIPEEPKKIFDAHKDPSWVEAMQEELLQFKIQNVWVLVDYPKGVRPIGTKWVLKNKKDKKGHCN
nr:putative ribonuclease H-like domain-containing protein [Tanacetum cinerariifolium]